MVIILELWLCDGFMAAVVAIMMMTMMMMTMVLPVPEA
jgi:hypothetical protein